MDNHRFLVLSPERRRPSAAGYFHESLLRQWKSLAAWVDEEAESARVYTRLAESAELHAGGKAGFYREADLQVALDWQRRQRPNAEWAARYHPQFELAMGFLEKSVRKQKTNRYCSLAIRLCIFLHVPG
jgi:hypothetical protein